VLVIGGFKRAPWAGPSIFAMLDFHQEDVPLVGSEQTGAPNSRICQIASALSCMLEHEQKNIGM